MKTPVEISDPLMRRVREPAAREGALCGRWWSAGFIA
jgi:hypothetical protein